jgi:two-component system OmpR family sensor kinase
VFRTLAARLTATYVFAAIVLVAAAMAAVMALALSHLAAQSRDAIDDVARRTPFEVRYAVAREHSLHAAAKEIVQNLAQRGLLIALIERGRERRGFVVATDATPGADGRPNLYYPARSRNPGGPPFGPPGFAERPPGHGPQAYPFGFIGPLHVEQRWVEIPGGLVRIMPDPAPFDLTVRGFLEAMVPIGLVAVLAAWILGRFITGAALRPLAETTASLYRFGAGDFTPRPVVTTDRNEIGELARAYNAAAAQVTAAFEERRLAEAHMRQFIADAGHELRTPLTVIMGFIDVLRRRSVAEAALKPGETAMPSKIYDTMLAESRRMKALIEKLIVLARLENVREREFETVDLGDVAAHVVSALQALERRPRIALRAEGGAVVRGDAAELHDAVSNLVENALKYAPDSPVEVSVRTEGDSAAVDVVDRGPGIPYDEQEQIFTRFYRGREHGDAEGFGLGLAIAKRAVERSGGTLGLASAPGNGSAFMIRVPLAPRGEAVALAV